MSQTTKIMNGPAGTPRLFSRLPLTRRILLRSGTGVIAGAALSGTGCSLLETAPVQRDGSGGDDPDLPKGFRGPEPGRPGRGREAAAGGGAAAGEAAGGGADRERRPVRRHLAVGHDHAGGRQLADHGDRLRAPGPLGAGVDRLAGHRRDHPEHLRVVRRARGRKDLRVHAAEGSALVRRRALHRRGLPVRVRGRRHLPGDASGRHLRSVAEPRHRPHRPSSPSSTSRPSASPSPRRNPAS